MTLIAEKKYIKSFDGLNIAYQIVGSGKKAFVLCNGLGGSLRAWEPIYKNFYTDYKFITWDYRGLFNSETPQELSELTLKHHAQDLKKILQKERVSKAIFAGWSMGVQVMLEFYQMYPKQVNALFMINGTYKSPFHTVLNSPFSRFILPKANEWLKRAMPKMQKSIKNLAHQAIANDHFITILSKLGFVHERLNPEIMHSIVGEILKMDLTIFHHLLHHLNEHDATNMLSQIKVPTLIIAGTNDKVTPASTAEKMAKHITNAEFMTINGGSHYTLLEFPELIVPRLKNFLHEHHLT